MKELKTNIHDDTNGLDDDGGEGQDCRFFRFARGRRLRLFLRSRNNSVRESNAQPAPITGLKKGVGVLPQQAETAVFGNAGNRSFESLWEQRHCLQSSETVSA